MSEEIITYEQLEAWNRESEKTIDNLTAAKTHFEKLYTEEAAKVATLTEELEYYEALLWNFKDVTELMAPLFHQLVELSFMASSSSEDSFSEEV